MVAGGSSHSESDPLDLPDLPADRVRDRRLSGETGNGSLPEKGVGPAVVKKTPPERPRRDTPDPQDDDAPLFVIEASAPSSGGPEGPRADEWAELGGPLFE